MNNYVLLNNVEHKNLKVIGDFAPKYGDNVMSTITFPQEFRTIQGTYPIFFSKDRETGRFFASAILGLREGENLFLTEKGWDANYIPVTIKRNPFVIGFQRVQEDGMLKKNMVVNIDISSPRISEAEGESVFLPHGGNSPYLESVVSILDYISVGDRTSAEFIDSLLQYDLLEPFSIEIELKNGDKNQLVGFYTINEEKLVALTSDILGDLHAKGYLLYIYMVLASLSNVEALIQRIEMR